MRRILLVLTAALVMASMLVAAVPAFAKGPPNGSQGQADPPTKKAQNGCNGFDHTPSNEPPFFQSTFVTC